MSNINPKSVAGEEPGTGVTVLATPDTITEGMVNRTTIELDATGALDYDLEDSVTNGAGQEIFTFPEGVILILGATLDGNCTSGGTVTGNYSLAVGTVTAANDDDLTATEADVVDKITVANGTDSAGHGFHATAPAAADGTTAAIKLFLNVAIANGSITNTGTVAVTGTLTFTWMLLGDY